MRHFYIAVLTIFTLTLAATAHAYAPWGLDRINQRELPLDNEFCIEDLASGAPRDGAGVTIYVVSTGINLSSSFDEFGGRAQCFWDVQPGNGCEDANGLGTFEASVAAGQNFGVAKGAQIRAVRVLNSLGSGSAADLTDGLQYIGDYGTFPGVVLIDSDAPNSTGFDIAVANLVAQGFTVVQAAGTSNEDACTQSTAQIPGVVTVGATTSWDSRASFSNWGDCIDLFAPGVDIRGRWLQMSTKTTSGTHAAAAHVAGVVAINGGNSAAVLASATPNRISDTMGSPNLLAYVPPCISPCAFDCVADSFACDSDLGIIHSDMNCSGGSEVCCQLPEPEACPYQCVTNEQTCSALPGFIAHGYSCGSSDVCCQGDPNEQDTTTCPFTCTPYVDCTMDGGTVHPGFDDCPAGQACCE